MDRVCSFTSTVAGATFLITLTGFSSAITHWAPLSLVSATPFSLLPRIDDTAFTRQLAEAILSDSFVSEEGAGSIRLADTRTFRSNDRHSGDDYEQRRFLLPDEENDNDANGDVWKSSLEVGRDRRPGSLLENAGAQLRRLDVDGLSENNENVAGAEDMKTTGSTRGLSAKAGIILVRHYTPSLRLFTDNNI
jgi:solute carrier family 45 protein 1/2/4